MIGYRSLVVQLLRSSVSARDRRPSNHRRSRPRRRRSSAKVQPSFAAKTAAGCNGSKGIVRWREQQTLVGHLVQQLCPRDGGSRQCVSRCWPQSPQVYLCCRPERLGNFSFQAPALVERLGRVPPLIEAVELTYFEPVKRFQPSLFGWSFVGPSSRSVSTSLPSSHSTASAV